MDKYVALIRGINVGGRIVKMVDLKVCLDKQGLKNVKTLLQSGNVVIEADSSSEILKAKIEKALSATFNYPAKVQVIPMSRLKNIVEAYPFDKTIEDVQNYVIFLENNLEVELVKEDYRLSNNEHIKLGDGVVYWQVNKGQTLKTAFSKLLTKSKYRDFNTNRNLNTLNKLLEL